MKKALSSIIIVGFLSLGYFFPHWMFQPGELIQPHQKINKDCSACHELFKGIPNSKCISCHAISEIGKDSLTLDSTQEKKVRFHQQLADQKCTSCHTDHHGLHAKINHFEHTLLSTSNANDCKSCHAPPENSLHQMSSTNCGGCHQTQGWKMLANFNHQQIEVANQNNCVACHLNPTNAMHQNISNECGACHNTTAWKGNVKFNHSMIQGKDAKNCIACHQKPNDGMHQMSNETCTTCHSQDHWKPATFEHSRYFILDGNHTASCNTCHTNKNFKSYTCYGCHEHSESKILSEHQEEGITNLNNCVSCHRSGNEHDIRNSGEGSNGGTQDINKINKYLEDNKKSKENDDD